MDVKNVLGAIGAVVLAIVGAIAASYSRGALYCALGAGVSLFLIVGWQPFFGNRYRFGGSVVLAICAVGFVVAAVWQARQSLTMNMDIRGVTAWSRGRGGVVSQYLGVIVRVVNKGEPQAITDWECQFKLKDQPEFHSLTKVSASDDVMPESQFDPRVRQAFAPDNAIYEKTLSPIEKLGQRVGALICQVPAQEATPRTHASGNHIRVRARTAAGDWIESDDFVTTDRSPQPGDPSFIPGLR
jgi:hypothetical protein